MSEEILRALMQLFAIIAKQDEGSGNSEREFVKEFLSTQINRDKVAEYLNLYDDFIIGRDKENKEPVAAESTEETIEKKPKRLTSVLESVKTLSICKKINKTLTQKQKIVVLIRMFELLRAENKFTKQRLSIITTAAEVFKIEADEYKSIESFIVGEDKTLAGNSAALKISDKSVPSENDLSFLNQIFTDHFHGELDVLKVNSVGLYFLKFDGESEVYLNGLPLNTRNVYLLAPGSALRLPRNVIYYSDIVSKYLNQNLNERLSFNVNQLEYKFPGGKIGLRNINISEPGGKLVGIMGASGAGKTTLLNVLSGLEVPSAGTVKINGIDIFKEKKKAEGIIGYIAQDDLLIEELTVYQNLYFNAQLCFKDKSKAELEELVNATLQSLGLFEIRQIIVGNPLNKKISGGQRKRLNIALELIREPSVLFVDEPTSGLSSRDSENVMDLLKELTLKGKLIFVVIHQPSSDIYKLFDKMVILDVGGYTTYYGNPIEAVMYFKRQASQINADVGECESCGNVNPEIMFNIIEGKEVDEYGTFTDKRKVSPIQWNESYEKEVEFTRLQDESGKPSKSFAIPGKIKQLGVFIKRDVLSKIGNKQYLLINLLEAPLLAFILAFIIRYTAGKEEKHYIFRENENVPAYIFMCIIVSLFIGLTVSAEEIFKDRKILKREKFLNLSTSSYLFSKIIILFTISAIQSTLFVLIGNYIIELKGMYLAYWFTLFSVSCCANVMGLNISATFNSAVTIYILIPLLIIPQMILGGAMFSFDKLNKFIGGGSKVPFVADLMVSRWAYEGLMVNQFVNNNYNSTFYEVDKKVSRTNYKIVYLIPELEQLTQDVIRFKEENKQKEFDKKIAIIKYELETQFNEKGIQKFKFMDNLNFSKFDVKTHDLLLAHLESLNKYYTDIFVGQDKEANTLLNSITETSEDERKFLRIKDTYDNEYLNDVVKKAFNKFKIIYEDNKIVQQVDAIYMEPDSNQLATLHTHFYSPHKYINKKQISTLAFNNLVIWLMSLVFFILLYFDGLKKILSFPNLLRKK